MYRLTVPCPLQQRRPVSAFLPVKFVFVLLTFVRFRFVRFPIGKERVPKILLTYNDRTVTHLHIKSGVAYGRQQQLQ